MRVVSLLVVVACSSPPSPQPTAPPPATPAPTAKEPPPAAPPVDEDAPRVEHATVQRDGLKIDVSWWTQTGTMHSASELVLTTATGSLTLVAPDLESGEMIPLLQQIEKVGDNRWVVLGWTSYGGGMQTDHAWLVDGSGAKPRIVDTLEWTTDRVHAGLVIDPATPLRIGIPLPTGQLHDESDWRLVHGTKTSTLAQVKKLPSSDVPLATVRAYTPPFHTPASQREWSGRFVWFDVAEHFEVN